MSTQDGTHVLLILQDCNWNATLHQGEQAQLVFTDHSTQQDSCYDSLSTGVPIFIVAEYASCNAPFNFNHQSSM